MKIDLRKTVGLYALERKLRHNKILKRISFVIGHELGGYFMSFVAKKVDLDDKEILDLIERAERARGENSYSEELFVETAGLLHGLLSEKINEVKRNDT